MLASIRERFEREQPLEGVRVGACLHVHRDGEPRPHADRGQGARRAVLRKPLSTQDDVAAALVVHFGAEVRARRGEDLDTYASHVAALVAGDPQITLDDGADLVSVLHATRPEAVEAMFGGTEETTTGLLRLRALEARPSFADLAVNEARTERVFNDRFGTGQSTLDGILRATNLLLAGARSWSWATAGPGAARRAARAALAPR